MRGKFVLIFDTTAVPCPTQARIRCNMLSRRLVNPLAKHRWHTDLDLGVPCRELTNFREHSMADRVLVFAVDTSPRRDTALRRMASCPSKPPALPLALLTWE